MSIRFEREGDVALLTIDRPKVHNALDTPAGCVAGLTVVLILLWMLMFWYAGNYQPQDARDALGRVLQATPATGQASEQPSEVEGEE